MDAPWEHRNTPLARAFARAFDRQSSVNATQLEPGIGAVTAARGAFLVSGLDVDPAELNYYLDALTSAYIAEAGTGPEDESGDQRAMLLMRGLAKTSWLAGRLAALEAPATLRGIDPATVGNEFWNAAVQNTGGTLDDAAALAAHMIQAHEAEKLARAHLPVPVASTEVQRVWRLVLNLELERARGVRDELKRMHDAELGDMFAVWELFDAVARELAELLDEG